VTIECCVQVTRLFAGPVRVDVPITNFALIQFIYWLNQIMNCMFGRMC